jgi:S-adenosylmethionine decarboxylase
MIQNKPDKFFFGVHFMVDGYDAPAEKLSDKEDLAKALLLIPENMGMHTISSPIVIEAGPNNKKDPGGLSGVVLIAESHLSFHTFPARGFVTIDVYTCMDVLDTAKLLEQLKGVFAFKTEETHTIERGRNYPSSNLY